jgi:hypothetical protein
MITLRTLSLLILVVAQATAANSFDKSMIEKLSVIGRDSSLVKKSSPREANFVKRMPDRKAEKFRIDLEEVDNFDNFVNNRNGKAAGIVDMNQLSSLFESPNGQARIKQPHSGRNELKRKEPARLSRGIDQLNGIYESLRNGEDKGANTIRYIPCSKGTMNQILSIKYNKFHFINFFNFTPI